MKREFVKTDNAKRFRAGVAMLEARGALEAGWMLVIGRPGEGKTTTLHNWAAEAGAVMLTAQEGWTPSRMLGELAESELAEKLGIEPVRGFEKKIEETIAGEEIPIVLDEAAFALHNSAACLERLRGITDKSCTLMVMAAMEQDRPKFARRMQIASRISYVCDFHKSTRLSQEHARRRGRRLRPAGRGRDRPRPGRAHSPRHRRPHAPGDDRHQPG